MILDTLDAIGKYAGISPNFETAVRWLQETDPEALEPGRTDIDGEKVYAVVSENRLEPKEPVFEVHRRYADIQIILQGREGFLYGREGRELSVNKACQEHSQYKKRLQKPLYIGRIFLSKPGSVYHVLPEKDRRPLSPAAPVPDRKLVVKVLMD